MPELSQWLFMCRLGDVCTNQLLDVALLIGDAGELVQYVRVGYEIQFHHDLRGVRSIIARLRGFFAFFCDGKRLLALKMGRFPAPVIR